MRREGRQHGMVWYCDSPRYPTGDTSKNTKLVNALQSIPTTGCVTKVSRKPTNHSRYTSRCCRPRCRGCHTHPVNKAQDKAKGTQKLRFSSDGIVDFSLKCPHNIRDSWSSDGFDDEEIAEHDDDHVVVKATLADAWLASKADMKKTGREEEDDCMSFSEIGFVLEDDDEQGWCLVQEM